MARKKIVTEKRGPWSRDEIKELRKLFPKMATAEVARAIGRPVEATKKKASRMGLTKSPKYLRSLGRGKKR